eukprot:1159531-Pelagomonas_calceolata.AAC.6
MQLVFADLLACIKLLITMLMCLVLSRVFSDPLGCRELLIFMLMGLVGGLMGALLVPMNEIGVHALCAMWLKL